MGYFFMCFKSITLFEIKLLVRLSELACQLKPDIGIYVFSYKLLSAC
jgi:hypothetical protein